MSIFLGLFLLLYFHSGARDRMLGAAIVEVIFAVGTIIYFASNGNFKFDARHLKQGFRFCFPLILAGVIYYPIIGLDQFFLERGANVKDLALYSIGLNFATYLHTFNYSVFQALEPNIINYCINKQHAKLKKTILSFLAFALLVCVSFNVVSKYIIAFLTNNIYTDAYVYCNILVYSFFFILVYSILVTVLNAKRMTKSIFVMNLVGGIISMALYYISSVYFGAAGVAYSRVLLFVFISLIGVYLLKRPQKLTVQPSPL
jgi:O-antigen/teichoic acid export membrane protein